MRAQKRVPFSHFTHLSRRAPSSSLAAFGSWRRPSAQHHGRRVGSPKLGPKNSDLGTSYSWLDKFMLKQRILKRMRRSLLGSRFAIDRATQFRYLYYFVLYFFPGPCRQGIRRFSFFKWRERRFRRQRLRQRLCSTASNLRELRTRGRHWRGRLPIFVSLEPAMFLQK